MFNNEICDRVTIQDRMRFQQYEMLYRNVRNRLCKFVEVLAHDFLQGQHEGGAMMLHRFKSKPMHFICRTVVEYIGGILQCESNYLVVAGGRTVVALRDPHEAVDRQLPFLSVLEGNVFQPYAGCPLEFWQTHIEPVVQESGNVIPGLDNSSVPLGGMLHFANVLPSPTLRFS